MIRYTLRCAFDHEFEGWFRDSATCDTQLAGGAVPCPYCGSTQVSKALMTPSVVSHRTRAAHRAADTLDRVAETEAEDAARSTTDPQGGTENAAAGAPASPPDAPAPPLPAPTTPAGRASAPADLPREVSVHRLHQALETLRKRVETTCEDVGGRFAEEARMIHYGEAEERPIYGDATLDEARALHDEGIAVAPLPWGRRSSSH